MPFLRQSTSQSIRFGPCLDIGDGVTEETALTITQAEMRLSKDGAAFAQKNAAGNATHDSDGWYSTTLNATDTDTVGELILNVQQPANMLPVWMRYYVVEEAVYDDLFAASADPFTVIQSDVAAIHSQTTVIESDSIIVESSVQAVETDTGNIYSDTTILTSDSIVIESSVQVAESNTVVLESDSIIIESSVQVAESNTVVLESDSIVIESSVQVVESDVTRLELALITATGALEGTPSATVLQTDLPEATDSHYVNMVFVMTSGDEAGEARRISAYTGATGTVTLDTALSGSPTAAETFAILNIPAVWERSEVSTTLSDLVIVESDSVVIESSVQVAESNTVVIESDSIIIESSVQVAESSVQVIESQTTVIESDVALFESAHSEPTGVPAANESPLDKLGYLFMVMRNRKTVTSTKLTVFGDDDVGEWEHDLSDNGTTMDESEANAI